MNSIYIKGPSKWETWWTQKSISQEEAKKHREGMLGCLPQGRDHFLRPLYHRSSRVAKTTWNMIHISRVFSSLPDDSDGAGYAPRSRLLPTSNPASLGNDDRHCQHRTAEHDKCLAFRLCLWLKLLIKVFNWFVNLEAIILPVWALVESAMTNMVTNHCPTWHNTHA